MKTTTVKRQTRPKQAAPDDPRWANLFERARGDADYLEMILALETNLDAVQVKNHTQRLEELELMHQHALSLTNPMRHVKLREINGIFIEHWRHVRAIARVGGKVTLNYGTLAINQHSPPPTP